MSRKLVVLLLVAAAGIVACTSRYRLKLNMTLGDETRSLKVEEARMVNRSQLGNPMSEGRVISGDAVTIVVRGSTRGLKLESGKDVPGPLTFDEYLKTNLYIELPAPTVPQTLPLDSRSFVQILERYDQPIEEKIFLPVGGGEIVVDSVTDNNLFASISGSFANRNAQTLVLSGSFKVDLPEK